MNNNQQTENLPAQIAEAVASVPKSLVPSSLKALDRLLGAMVDLPVAWLNQKKAKIEAQTQSFALVEAAIAQMAASEASGDTHTVQRAVNVLIRKEYRKQINREAVATAMIEELKIGGEHPPSQTDNDGEIDDDWLNVFQRYAEDASTERMQTLWGRVLAGEIRQNGKYSMRTLRFLSEFSQADALNFADFCESAFSDIAPEKLVKPEGSDVRTLIYMESAGLIEGASGLGLSYTFNINDQGIGFIVEKNLALVLKSEPNTKIEINVCVLTPLGQELLTLLPTRDARQAARDVANAIRNPLIELAFLAIVSNDGKGSLTPLEILWQKDQPPM